MTDKGYARRRLVVGILLLLFLTISLIGEGMRDRAIRFWLGVVVCFGALLVVACCSLVQVRARDLGQWGNSDRAIKAWFESLMQPDHPNVSCCGSADAYWCDEVHVRDGHTFCNITDDRPDEPLKRPHVPVGTEIAIPDWKLKWDRGNPSGHTLVFLSSARFVFCFVQGSGV